MLSFRALFAPQRPVAWLSICALLTGCNTNPTPSPEITIDTREHLQQWASAPPVLRIDRYTFTSLKPKPDQRDLLHQIVDIRIPDHLAPTVKDALTYVLRRTGYQLGPATADTTRLFALPLPAAHYRVGPIRLREALKMLAGPAWELQTQELERKVCFSLRPEYGTPVAQTKGAAQ